MKCNHIHKDAPENAQCEDCGTNNNLEGEKFEPEDETQYGKAGDMKWRGYPK